jgi:hypothetical protein
MHEGTKFETLRLFCNLARYGSADTRSILLSETTDLISVLFEEMLPAQHAVLIMDALLALIILTQTAVDIARQQLPSNWSDVLVNVINDAVKRGRFEILSNALTLIALLGTIDSDDWNSINPMLNDLLAEATSPQCSSQLWTDVKLAYEAVKQQQQQIL